MKQYERSNHNGQRVKYNCVQLAVRRSPDRLALLIGCHPIRSQAYRRALMVYGELMGVPKPVFHLLLVSSWYTPI